MSSAQQTPPRLRLVSTHESPQRPADHAAATALHPDWSRILRDITCCGVVRLQVGNDCARLSSMAEPWSAAVHGRAVWLEGPGLAIAGLTDRWALAGISQGPCSERYTNLDICDPLGQRVLRISLNEDSNWTHFSAGLVRQWAARRTAPDSPARDGLQRDLDQLQRHTNFGPVGALHACWYDAARDHRNGDPVDPSLLAPLLETLSDQACPLSVIIGNRGLIQQYGIPYFELHQRSSLLRLRGGVSELELDLQGITEARVTRGTRPFVVPWIRLYDALGRCVAGLGLAADADHADRELWQVMLRALLD